MKNLTKMYRVFYRLNGGKGIENVLAVYAIDEQQATKKAMKEIVDVYGSNFAECFKITNIEINNGGLK